MQKSTSYLLISSIRLHQTDNSRTITKERERGEKKKTLVSSVTAPSMWVLCMATRRSSWVPREKLKMATFIPARNSFFSIGTDRDLRLGQLLQYPPDVDVSPSVFPLLPQNPTKIASCSDQSTAPPRTAVTTSVMKKRRKNIGEKKSDRYQNYILFSVVSSSTTQQSNTLERKSWLSMIRWGLEWQWALTYEKDLWYAVRICYPHA